MTQPTAGERFRIALAAEQPLQVVGTINAYSALLAERSGFRAIYLSGAGVANASFGPTRRGSHNFRLTSRGRHRGNLYPSKSRSTIKA